MKKTIFAFLLLVIVLTFSNSIAYADDVYAINGDDVPVLGASYDARYQNNLDFMNGQFTDSKRLELLLRPSYDIDSDNKNVIALANKITASLTDDYAKAQAIHDWVSNNIYYTANDPLADYYGFVIDAKGERVFNEYGEEIFSQEASYVIESKRAYCEGYANLTCALLRAVGIPSLVYDGFALSDVNSWGPHAWTGAYIKSQKKWIIMDTTYDSSNRYYDGEYKTEKARKAYFDTDLPTFSKIHFNFTPIYAANPDEDIDLEIAELHGATVDYSRTELYFYFDEFTIGKYSHYVLNPGSGVWDIESERSPQYDSWVSSNPKVARVNQDGYVTAFECGTTTISLAFLDKGMVASFTLTVKEPTLSLWTAPFLTVGESYWSVISDYENEESELNSRSFLWKSSNPKVLKVDEAGKITAVASGKAKVTATIGDTVVGPFEVQVYPLITNVKLTKKSLTLAPNSEYEDIDVTFTPSNVPNPRTIYQAAEEDEKLDPNSSYLKWSSSNPKVVSVEGKATLTAIKEGSAVITVSMVKYKSDGTELVLCSDTCKVTVKTPAKYKVTFKSNGGTAVKAITAVENSLIDFPKDPTRKDYIFEAWYKDSDCTKVWDFEKDIIKGNTTLYAGWTPSNPYYVILNLVDNAGYAIDYWDSYYDRYNYDKEAPQSMKYVAVVRGKTMKKPADPVLKGHTFIGWYNAETGKKWDFAKDKVTSNFITLNTRWKKTAASKTTYNVTIQPNNGVSPKILSVTIGSKISEPETPSPRVGYKFVGWYKDSKFTKQWNFKTDTVKGPTTLYAKWQKKLVSILITDKRI